MKPGDTVLFSFDGSMSIPQAELYAAHTGQTATVVRQLEEPEVDEGVLMYQIRFSDGFLATAWSDELIEGER